MTVAGICALRGRWSRLRKFLTRMAVAASAVSVALLGASTVGSAAEPPNIRIEITAPAAQSASPRSTWKPMVAEALERKGVGEVQAQPAPAPEVLVLTPEPQVLQTRAADSPLAARAPPR